MFENETINGIYYSRFIASYRNSCEFMHARYYRKDFIKWLLSIGIDGKTANKIAELGENGKLELEESSRAFILTENVKRW